MNFRSSNRSIDSISNSLIEDQKYNVKKHWLSDREQVYGREDPPRRKNSLRSVAMNSMSDRNRFDAQPYSNSSYLGETEYSQSSMKRANSVAYGPDGLAFGIIPKEVMDQIEESGDEWINKNKAFEIIHDIVQEVSSISTLTPYAPSFLKFNCN